jgi:uncharacterized protein YjbI with pentapeptide repeats
MADVESLRKLTLGVREWNDYRIKHPGRVDLSHLELRNVNFRGADFRDIDFDGCVLTNVDFRGGDFRKARLNGINATRASFERAKMTSAELKGSDLKHVSLRDACLRGVDTFDLKIRHSSLVRADFSDAKLPHFHIYNSDLQGAIFTGAVVDGAVIKRGLIDAHGATALRATGLVLDLPNMPTIEQWLDWEGFDVNESGDDFGVVICDGKAYWVSEGRWDFFISHASADKETVARPLAQALATRGQRVWYDERQIKVGDNLADVIAFGTKASLFGVVVLSKAFFGRHWTEAELAALTTKRVFLVLHGLEPEDLRRLRPELENRFHALSSWGLDRVADSLIAAISAPPVQKGTSQESR